MDVLGSSNNILYTFFWLLTMWNVLRLAKLSPALRLIPSKSLEWAKKKKNDPHKFTFAEWSMWKRSEDETFFLGSPASFVRCGILFRRQLLWPRPSHRLHSMCSFHFSDGPSVQNGSMRQQSGSPSLRIHTSSNFSLWLILGRLRRRFFLSFFFNEWKAKSSPTHMSTQKSAEGSLCLFSFLIRAPGLPLNSRKGAFLYPLFEPERFWGIWCTDDHEICKCLR